ncbi:MAG: 2Fe-2S iron-sulfur cluster-binding protein [Dehalococcoidia bacterium]|nr:2Fe-2S iron-sulfur cluster-binding protein [Dehalococcoidia bacterium]
MVKGETGEITFTINNRKVSGRQGMTILEVALENGIYIPTLCYRPDLSPSGNCRLCVVEVEGSRTLVGSCHTPVTPGMTVLTDSPKVVETRRIILELMLSSHSGTCYMCDKANICELRKLAAEMDVGLPRFSSHHRYYQKEETDRHIIDLSKCVLCRRCVRASAEITKDNVLAIANRGFYSKVVAGCDDSIGKALAGNDTCVLMCPSGALTTKVPNKEKIRTLVIRG